MRSTVHTNLPNMKGKKTMRVCPDGCEAINKKNEVFLQEFKKELVDYLSQYKEGRVE